MTLETSLNSAPYYDDYSVDKNFYRILFKPSVALQARELTQLQSILQNQIEKFGNHIFKDGSIVSGVAINTDDAYSYVKIKDSYSNGANFTISDFQNYYVKNSAGVTAIIVNTVSGLESNYSAVSETTKKNSLLNTLYVKYTNTASDGVTKVFAADDVLTIQNSDGSIVLGTVSAANSSTYPVGQGYALSVSSGVIFQKGFFVQISPQTIIVNNYFTTANGAPNGVSVGFKTSESIITSNVDDTLLDNAFGAPNYAAPGADRLKLTAELVLRDTNTTTDTDDFTSIVDFDSGKPVVINSVQYNTLGDELARRTFEESGNYVVNPFSVGLKAITSNTTHLNAEIGSGIGYVNGYRVEIFDKINKPIRKGTDTLLSPEQLIGAGVGSYVFVDELAGEFNFNTLASVELHNAAQNAVSSNATLLSTTYSSATKIGTANIRGIKLENGVAGSSSATYRLYLFNINMDSGYNFSQVKSVIQRTGGSTTGISDTVLELDPSTGSNICVLKEGNKAALVFSTGQKAVKNLVNTEFTFRNRKAGISFDTNGQATLTLATAVGTGDEILPYGVGTLSDSQEGDFVFVVTTAGNTTVRTGTVAVNTTSANVTGTTTNFLTDYKVGDYFTANSYGTRNIVSITNNTLMTVSSPFTSTVSGQAHWRSFPVGSVIPVQNRPEASLNVTNSTSVSVNLGLGTANISSPPTVTAYYNTIKGNSTPARQKTKTINKNRFVKIDLANNVNSTTGPWCLGLPDVVRIRNVYLGNNATYSNSVTNVADYFVLDTGQRDSHYGLAYLKIDPKKNVTLFTSNTILVELDHFTHNQDSESKAYFTVESYPIDDANTANTNAVTTQEIPIYTSVISGQTFDLRSSVDFRHTAANTAASATTVAGATINPSTTLTFSLASTSSGSNSYVIVPDSIVESDVNFYLGRIDSVSINPQTKINITEGISGTNFRSSPIPSDSMLLAEIYVPPYPSLDTFSAYNYNRSDLSASIDVKQQRRFTMRDINTLKERIENLEYYVSLNMLEQNTKNLTIKNETTGLDRFKNGFLVDPFVDHSIGDTTDPAYNIALDNGRAEIRPIFQVTAPSLNYESTLSTNITQTGGALMLPYTEVAYISQSYSNGTRNLNDLSVYSWQGSATLNPNNGQVDVAAPVIPSTPTDANKVNNNNGNGFEAGYIVNTYTSYWSYGGGENEGVRYIETRHDTYSNGLVVSTDVYDSKWHIINSVYDSSGPSGGEA